MSNLLKAGTVRPGEEKRVIDYNSLIQEKISSFRKAALANSDAAGDGFIVGIQAETVESLIDPEEELKKAQEEAERIRREAEKVLQNAKERASELVEDARVQAKAIKEEARRQGEEEGYAEGVARGQSEVDRLKQEMEERRQEEHIAYEEQMHRMEPQLVDVILQVFEKVTHVLSQNRRDMIFYLVDSALNRIESSKQFVVRVSKEDYPFVVGRKDMLKEQIPMSSEIEIVKDTTLIRNQCLIETDGGVFDCGLDTQLENLIEDIKVLSIQ